MTIQRFETQGATNEKGDSMGRVIQLAIADQGPMVRLDDSTRQLSIERSNNMRRTTYKQGHSERLRAATTELNRIRSGIVRRLGTDNTLKPAEVIPLLNKVLVAADLASLQIPEGTSADSFREQAKVIERMLDAEASAPEEPAIVNIPSPRNPTEVQASIGSPRRGGESLEEKRARARKVFKR